MTTLTERERLDQETPVSRLAHIPTAGSLRMALCGTPIREEARPCDPADADKCVVCDELWDQLPDHVKARIWAMCVGIEA